MVCFPIKAKGPVVGEPEECRATREQLSSGQEDHDRPAVKHVTLADKVSLKHEAAVHGRVKFSLWHTTYIYTSPPTWLE